MPLNIIGQCGNHPKTCGWLLKMARQTMDKSTDLHQFRNKKIKKNKLSKYSVVNKERYLPSFRFL
jgi:hypothetical protein